MIIGIDIDDTVSLTNDKMVEEACRFDREQLKGKGYKNRKAYSFMEMFYWSVLDVDAFLKYIRTSKFFLEVEPIDRAVQYINKLYDEGNKIVFITRREITFKVKSMTKKWLKKHGFKYNKLVLGAKKKGEVCEKEGVSFFVDNDIKNVYDVLNCGIDAVLMADSYNKDENELVRVENWQELYKTFGEMMENGKNS